MRIEMRFSKVYKEFIDDSTFSILDRQKAKFWLLKGIHWVVCEKLYDESRIRIVERSDRFEYYALEHGRVLK